MSGQLAAGSCGWYITISSILRGIQSSWHEGGLLAVGWTVLLPRQPEETKNYSLGNQVDLNTLAYLKEKMNSVRSAYNTVNINRNLTVLSQA